MVHEIMIESWMVSLFIAILGIAGTWGIIKSKLETLFVTAESFSKSIVELEKFRNEKTPLLSHLSRIEEAYGKKLDSLGKEVIELKTKLANVPTMDVVRNEFVSKEMFKQMEKHIDEKFDKLENGIEKILDKLEKGA